MIKWDTYGLAHYTEITTYVLEQFHTELDVDVGASVAVSTDLHLRAF